MYQVKLMGAGVIDALEEKINKFLAIEPDLELIDIKYQDESSGEIDWWSAMIIYKS